MNPHLCLSPGPTVKEYSKAAMAGFLCLCIIAPQLAGCGLAFSRTGFLNATSEGKLHQGQRIEEIRELVGKPDHTKSLLIGETPVELWYYKQTSDSDKRNYVVAVVASFGLAGLMPVRASEEHFIVFADSKVISWDMVPQGLPPKAVGRAPGGPVGTQSTVEVSIVSVHMPPVIAIAPRRLAVVKLSDTTGHELPAWMDFTVTLLRQRQPSITLVERDTLDTVLQEVLIQHSGRMTDDTVVQVGKMVGADSLLTYGIEPLPATTLGSLTRFGGAVLGSVEIRVIQLEQGVTLFRQLTTSRVLLPSPGKGVLRPEETVKLAHQVAVERAASYGLSGLAAAFGANPLGVVPDLSKKVEGIELIGVLDGGPAHAAGMEAGDVIKAVNGRPLRTWTDPIPLPANLAIMRQGKTREIKVQLGVPN